MEFWATALVRVCRHLTGTHLRPVRVRFVHPRCGSSDEQDAFFGCKVAFGAERDEITFARGASQLPFVGADHYLNELLIGYCEEILARRARTGQRRCGLSWRTPSHRSCRTGGRK